MNNTATLLDILSFGRYPFPVKKSINELQNMGYTVFVDLSPPNEVKESYNKYLKKKTNIIHLL